MLHGSLYYRRVLNCTYGDMMSVASGVHRYLPSMQQVRVSMATKVIRNRIFLQRWISRSSID